MKLKTTKKPKPTRAWAFTCNPIYEFLLFTPVAYITVSKF